MIVAGLESSFQVFDMRTQHPQEGFAHLSEKVGLHSLLRIKVLFTMCSLKTTV